MLRVVLRPDSSMEFGINLGRQRVQRLIEVIFKYRVDDDNPLRKGSDFFSLFSVVELSDHHPVGCEQNQKQCCIELLPYFYLYSSL